VIKTSRQLKDLVRNQAKGDSGKSQLLIRNYAMERFLERVSLSRFKDNFILKGGMLVSSIVGIENRSTMDIDTTLCKMPLDTETARKVVKEITSVPVEDNVRFVMKDASNIMDEAEYGGVRLSLDAILDTARIPLKIDISTGDVVTPSEIKYNYKLMFEDRYITLWAYNLETVLAEKIETVLSRSVFNTRLRDFYDLYILRASVSIDIDTLVEALTATCRRRKSVELLSAYSGILDKVEESASMQKMWRNYQLKSSYVTGIAWTEVMQSIRALCDSCVPRSCASFFP